MNSIPSETMELPRCRHQSSDEVGVGRLGRTSTGVVGDLRGSGTLTN